jgi:hypothetical protein
MRATAREVRRSLHATPRLVLTHSCSRCPIGKRNHFGIFLASFNGSVGDLERQLPSRGVVALRGGLQFLDRRGQVAFGQFEANAQLGKLPSVSPDAFRLVSDLLDLSVSERSGARTSKEDRAAIRPTCDCPQCRTPESSCTPTKDWPPASQWPAASGRTSTLMITPS